ncbi:TetR family transcriptional regulator [Streptomyces angustmyceticus]|uniref:TetR family transcriptional regulator n=1 Tax=Streptomyces angustmyceticus TaxID=285578 RepID=A0A5J4L808_9ACTN|nr:TetR family transcriptional regulator [Streptomyces angustmyceticus]UAL67382.1 TetR family transcriptional regulator [Streptomyces angustmyceticus]GES30283.1 TetR family transcriptional regulator [Streptomyces angustmyceticus]
MLRMAAAISASTPPGAPIGRRERKKIQTRQAIRRAAYRLFEEHGYDATPVDRIAEAAEVSPSTVFRYFPAKEDIVLTDEYDAVLETGIRARPADEPVIESVRQISIEALRAMTAEDRGELVQRVRLIREVPAIRGRTAERTARDAAMLTTVLAERSGRPADDLELRVISAVILAALQEALLHWGESGRTTDAEASIHRAMDVLGRGLTL